MEEQSPMSSLGDVMMKSAMLWGASDNSSADLLFEEAGLKKRSSSLSEDRSPKLTPPIRENETEFFTTADMPIRISGGDPMHAVTAVVNNEPLRSDGEPLFNDGEFSVHSKDLTIGNASLISSANMTEYSLPEWIMGEVADVPPSWEPLANNAPVYTWCGRSTHSDVVCVMNTTNVFRDISEVLPKPKPQNRKKVGGRLPSSTAISSSPFAGSSSNRDPKKLCRLPYAGGRGNNLVQVKASTTTLLAKERAAESRRRINAQLVS
jgi:hypothetical protein